LDAFAQVLITYPDARLVLVGDGTQRHAMMRYADELGIAHALRFTGLVLHAEVPELIGAADIAVAPYPKMDHELWLSPMKLYEYMASGTPIVATAAGQIPEVVKEGENGLLVAAGDATAMAAALKKLIDDPSLRSRLGRQARNDAVRKHSWACYLSRLEQVFVAVIDGQPVHLTETYVPPLSLTV
jgi:glycosyltransferase involved in cell wall biosynthesis